MNASGRTHRTPQSAGELLSQSAHSTEPFWRDSRKRYSSIIRIAEASIRAAPMAMP